jgi:hypothetical protein
MGPSFGAERFFKKICFRLCEVIRVFRLIPGVGYTAQAYSSDFESLL